MTSALRNGTRSAAGGAPHAGVEVRVVEAAGARLRILIEGPPGAPAILFIHGWGASLEWWDPIADRLKRDRRVVRIDLPGHGNSADGAGPYDVVDAGRALAEALGPTIGPDACVVGQSLGGLLAIEIGAHAREQVGSVILISTPPALRYRRLPLLGRLTLVPGLGRMLRATAPKRLVRRNLRFLVAPGRPVPPAAVDGVRGLSWQSYTGWNAAIERYVQATPTPAERLAALAKPALVLWGGEDRFWVPEALDEFAGLSGVETELVPGAGHSVHHELPGETAAAIARFLGEASTA